LSQSSKPSPDKAKLLDFETEKEEWNVYRLEDGTIVKVKAALANARLRVNEKGEPIPNPDGTPQYEFQFETKVRVLPENRIITVIKPSEKKPQPPGMYG